MRDLPTVTQELAVHGVRVTVGVTSLGRSGWTWSFRAEDGTLGMNFDAPLASEAEAFEEALAAAYRALHGVRG